MMSRGMIMIKECPCYREFEGEQLCVNDHEVKTMVTIDVDVELLKSELVSKDFITSESQDDICFCLAYLGEDGLYYCMSQQRCIRVRGQEVSEDEMQSALDVLAPKNVRYSSHVCGECLYNVIASLKEGGTAYCPV